MRSVWSLDKLFGSGNIFRLFMEQEKPLSMESEVLLLWGAKKPAIVTRVCRWALLIQLLCFDFPFFPADWPAILTRCICWTFPVIWLQSPQFEQGMGNYIRPFRSSGGCWLLVLFSVASKLRDKTGCCWLLFKKTIVTLLELCNLV